MKIKLAIIGLLLICQCCAQQHWQALGLGVQNFNTTTYIYSDTIDNLMYIGGPFNQVDGNNVRGIASWNGTNWDPLGDGIDSFPSGGSYPGNTWGMTRFGSYLYSCGNFRWAGEVPARYLARWNGVVWDTIPGGQPNNVVDDIMVYNNELYICGTFDSVGNIPASGIARWDGAAWHAIGNNYPFAPSGWILKMIFYHNDLYVGGIYDDPQGNTCRLAKWDGTSWQFLTTDLTGSIADVWDFAVYNDELYVSGLFYAGIGNNPGNSIMRWNDTTWRDVGGSAEFYSHNVPQVRQMCVYNGKLFCAGNFEIMGGIFAFGLASWDGTNWCGYNTSFTVNSQECGTFNLAFYNDTLYVGGGFAIVEGDTMIGIAKWIGGNYVDTCGNATGITESHPNNLDFSLYPNPISNMGTFEAHGTNENFTLVIFDQLGREVFRKISDGIRLDFTTEGITPGFYYYNIMQEGEVQKSGKMIVE